jgi:hypothetical protein
MKTLTATEYMRPLLAIDCPWEHAFRRDAYLLAVLPESPATVLLGTRVGG